MLADVDLGVGVALQQRADVVAHRVGAQVLLNGYHSVGVIPVDVTGTQVDFYIGGTLKWQDELASMTKRLMRRTGRRCPNSKRRLE